MAAPKLNVELRDGGGRRYSIKLRKNGFIPGVIYGHNKQTKSIKLKEIELSKVLNKFGSGSTVNLNLNGEVIPAIIKEVQKDIIKDNLLHIDFQQLSEDEEIKVFVPVVLVGKGKVENSTTIIQQQIMELEIRCLPKYIPSSIEVDVSNLKFGDSITVGDLNLGENIEILHDEDEVIASLTANSKYEELEEDKDVPIYESNKSILDK
ncbi:large subunit ribosomal protein L25 [Caloranaerobacter azorensis DSM 13643]|uniref:Large ribosomal subunit protein bL25 n=1 Tax=Caloranaerobacter azorensis DSM 13643 TaxID=1121264 RepID=A0A1M5T7Z5_9FIRM|nr:50S ribosomal protein L25 [Caloranaerobacter azorensis]SHH46842.1 large subunit ribosomal protein L25 [Caloranaerobacter azorensis DSM 13643]